MSKIERNLPARAHLGALIDHAKRAVARGGRYDAEGNFTPDPTAPEIAAVNGTVPFSAMLPNMLDDAGFLTAFPAYTRESEVATLRTALLQSSVALSFGAHLIELPEPNLETDPAGLPILAELPAGLDVIRPAAFAPVTLTGTGADAEGELTASTNPIARAVIDRDALEQIAFRVNIGRSELRAHGSDVIEAQLMAAIASGAGAALDGVLLRAIAAACDELTAAAAPHAICARSGVRWRELKAAIGQNAIVPTVDADRLLVGGIHAEHTTGAAHAVLGAWDRCGVAVEREMSVLIERHGLDGGLVVTAWFDAQALVPAPAFFAEVVAA
jgi:hypothetical protein